MSASATSSRRMRLAIPVCLLIAGFCWLFNTVYTSMSYGESSAYMAYMFLIPLVGGVLPALLLTVAGRACRIPRSAFNVWNCGLATLTVGCAVRGVINISGRFTDYDAVYWIAGGLLLLLSVALTVAKRIKKHSGAPG